MGIVKFNLQEWTHYFPLVGWGEFYRGVGDPIVDRNLNAFPTAEAVKKGDHSR